MMTTRLQKITFHLVNGVSVNYDIIGCPSIEHFLAIYANKPEYILPNVEKMSGMVIPKDRVILIQYEVENEDA